MGKPCVNLEYHGHAWASMGSDSESEFPHWTNYRTNHAQPWNTPPARHGRGWDFPQIAIRNRALARSVAMPHRLRARDAGALIFARFLTNITCRRADSGAFPKRKSPRAHNGPEAPMKCKLTLPVRPVRQPAPLLPPARAPRRSQPRRSGSLPGSARWSRHACAARPRAHPGTCRSH